MSYTIKITPNISSAGKTLQAIRLKIRNCCNKQMDTAGALSLGKSCILKARATFVDQIHNTKSVTPLDEQFVCKLVSTSVEMNQRDSLCCMIHHSLRDHICRLHTNDNSGVVAVHETEGLISSMEEIKARNYPHFMDH